MPLRNTFPTLLLLSLFVSACASTILPESAPISPTAAPLDEKSDIVTPVPADPTQQAFTDPSLPPIDVDFTVDCSAVDPARQPDCDDFIHQTATLVYPRLVQLTGISLANCFKEITYTILPDDRSQLAGGYTTGNQITYQAAYSIDSNIPYDVHELIHSFAWCSTAFDAHIFHGALMNAVYFDLGAPQFSQYPSEAGVREEFDRVLAALAPLPAAERFDLCTGAFADLVSIVHFQRGDEALTRLYQSTIAPPEIDPPPSDFTYAIWNGWVETAQSLYVAIVAELGPTDLSLCGF
jgi:hypothetical protein